MDPPAFGAEMQRRGWTWTETDWQRGRRGDPLRLHERWRWPSGIDHPFHGLGPTKLDRTADVVSGTTPGGHAFWALHHPYSLGTRSFAHRTIAFVTVGRPLPLVSVATVASSQTTSRLAAWAERRARPLDPVGSEVAELAGFVIRGSYQARAWLLRPEVRAALTEARSVSVTTNGADFIGWADDRGFEVRTLDGILPVIDVLHSLPD